MEEEQIKRIRKIRNRILIIIVAIWIVTFGFLIISEEPWSHSKVSNCGGISQQEKDMYNAHIQKYIGDSKSGSSVKQMIDAINTQNSQNVGENGKFISTYQENVKGFKELEDEELSLESVGKAANVYEDDNADNNQAAIDNAKKAYENLRKQIKSNRAYNIEAEYIDGIIYKVTIIGIK